MGLSERAATSLSRRLQRQGKREEARRMLAEIHSRFTEGFDTVNLRNARTFAGRAIGNAAMTFGVRTSSARCHFVGPLYVDGP